MTFIAGALLGFGLAMILWRIYAGAVDDPNEITDSQRIDWLEENKLSVFSIEDGWRIASDLGVIRDISLRRAINRAMMEK